MNDVTLRLLRLWHWKQVIRARKRMEDRRASPWTKKDAERDWAFHMMVVQELNDLVPGHASLDTNVPGQEIFPKKVY